MIKLLKKSQDLMRLVRHFRLQGWRKRRGPQIQAYLASTTTRKLQIGTGLNILPGWLNTDYSPGPDTVHLAASESYPIPTESFDYVYAEHIIEHIHYREALRMLQECHRVLKPGGKIRLVTPDLDIYVGFLKPQLSPIERECVDRIFNDLIKPGFHAAKNYQPLSDQFSKVFVLNDLFRNYEHCFLYDFATLAELVSAAGFHAVQRAPTGTSPDPNLSGIEYRSTPVFAYSNLVVEASK